MLWGRVTTPRHVWICVCMCVIWAAAPRHVVGLRYRANPNSYIQCASTHLQMCIPEPHIKVYSHIHSPAQVVTQVILC